MILGDCRALSGKRNNSASFLRMLLVVTTVVSTLVVVLAVGGNGGVFIRDTPSLLRRGYSEADVGITVSDPSALAFRRPRRISRYLEETNVDDNTTVIDTDLCDLEYCQTAFVKESLCPEEAPEKSFIASVPIFVQILILVVLLSFSALFSGLTLGLMSLDITGLEIVMAGDDPDAARYAETIYPLRKQGNLLLCTLLLGNVAVNSLMAIFTAAIFNGTIGFVSSTFLIVIFGEIIPQALCSRYALRIGSAAVPTVQVIKYLLYIISWPLAKGLDLALGRELATTYSNAEMIELLNVHVKENKIGQDEANAMAGALTYKNIPVKDAMTAMEHTFMLGVDEKLSFETIGKIFKTGYSRIPVFEISKSNIIGLLFVKDLIFLDPEDCVPVRSFIQIFGRNVHVVWPDDLLGDVLAVLKKGKSHLAVVRDVNNDDENQDPFYEVKGIITLEDIVERIIGDSIVDETDAFVDRDQRIKVERGETFEWARLRLLDTKIVDEMLSASEIGAITAHFKTNHSKPFGLLTDSQLTRLVSSTPVTTLPTATQELDKELPNDLLYEKNVPNDTFTLILSGKVTIFVGSENFRSDISSWSVLGGKSLEDKQWAPDYSAYVSDGPCRFIQIHRDAFVEAADASVFERRVSESNSNAIRLMASSVASSLDINEDTRSMTSENSSKVPNRRKDVLAKLFDNGTNNHCIYDEGDDEADPEEKEVEAELSKLSNGIAGAAADAAGKKKIKQIKPNDPYAAK
eukprot:CAMPEP_0197280056 /NCGR_PEP_ID=MMETSP1432-20130617/20974_1 /TAXON_ID=44447 /ORGANISM="Pseudo-nitzschia delicatissima, Strain UNC1205" /LENGTH=744 /DNA_ID=CAMNT_0042746681 /DNA_START=128 /DNA_END=2363 /DNA_ORIENTATION=-